MAADFGCVDAPSIDNPCSEIKVLGDPNQCLAPVPALVWDRFLGCVAMVISTTV